MATDWVVRVAHLSFARGSRKIFDDVSFEIARGEVVAVMGPSGTGKTTLMRLLTGQLRPDAGTVEVLGESLMRLQRVGLRGAAALMPAELSGGMARRVALARAIAFDPELMIYDEPFTGQDPISLGVLTRLVRDLNDGLRMTSFVVSHDVAEVSKIADRILLFSGGKLLANGAPAELYASTDPLVHQFMHAEADGPVAFHFPAADYAQGLLERMR